jgi:SAM-dependent methyltransferase
VAVSELTLRNELLAMARGGWLSHLLVTASEAGVFAALAAGGLTAEDAAAACGTDPDATARLLGACAAAGLLTHAGGRFGNGPMAEAFLVPGRPGYLGHWVALMGDFTRVWSRLGDTIRTGKPVGPPEGLGAGQGLRTFALAMHEWALGPGRDLVSRVDLAGRRRLLDVGGGLGTYAVLLAERFPSLRATVLDTEAMVALARPVIAAAGLADRVDTRAGDYTRDDLGEAYDAALLSNVLHQEAAEGCRVLLRRVHAALDPGGLVIVNGIHVNADGVGPLWPALQSLLQLQLWGGRVYSLDDSGAMLREAGFVDLATIPGSLLSGGGALLVATKPAGPVTR